MERKKQKYKSEEKLIFKIALINYKMLRKAS